MCQHIWVPHPYLLPNTYLILNKQKQNFIIYKMEISMLVPSTYFMVFEGLKWEIEEKNSLETVTSCCLIDIIIVLIWKTKTWSYLPQRRFTITRLLQSSYAMNSNMDYLTINSQGPSSAQNYAVMFQEAQKIHSYCLHIT